MSQKLPRSAYIPVPGEEYQPLVQTDDSPEFTLKAVLCGIVLGVVFGAANTYLGLKAGLTISTSIPVAVLTVVVFRLLSAAGGKHSLLEANMSQTIGSASSSVASGVLFTVPALFIWGMEPAWAQLTGLAMAGGLLGVLCMIPLRRFLIKREHGTLPYPEGMACAEVLVASESGGPQARNVFWGIGLGMLFKGLTDALKIAAGKFSVALPARATVSVSVSPALMGVGYILGIRIATVMVAGSALSALVIVPAIFLWGRDLNAPFYPEVDQLIRNMSAGDLRDRYVRYIGAGAVATGGIITLIRSIPTMIESFRIGIAQIGKNAEQAAQRTDRDLSLKTVLGLGIGILAVLTIVPGILGFIDSVFVRLTASLLIAVFAFFFVTVSSRIVGLVGVTSNPTSGMTIATLLGTSLIFLLMGWTDAQGKATALMVGTAVAIAASIAGDTSQDLKTGYLLGATPRWQQIGELVGVITSAGMVCFVIAVLHRATEGGLGGSELPAPQGTLMKLIIDGVLDQKLPWTLILIGVGIGLAAWVARLPVLPFAVGVYLPLSTMGAVFLGGLMRFLLTRNQPEAIADSRREQGVLFGSGLVGGGGLMGVVIAMIVLVRGEKLAGLPMEHWFGSRAPEVMSALAVVLIGLILLLLRYRATRPMTIDE